LEGGPEPSPGARTRHLRHVGALERTKGSGGSQLRPTAEGPAVRRGQGPRLDDDSIELGCSPKQAETPSRVPARDPARSRERSMTTTTETPAPAAALERLKRPRSRLGRSADQSFRWLLTGFAAVVLVVLALMLVRTT